MQTKVAQEKKAHTFSVTIKKMTKGELLSLKNALTAYAEISVVANDVLVFLEMALKEANIEF